MKTLLLDFETSGLNPYHCDVIEIGAKIHETNATYSSLIRPKSETPISDKITEITGITNREIRKVCREKGWTKGGWYDGYAEFYFWLIENIPDEEVTIVSHNGTTFDFIILKQMMCDIEQGGGDMTWWLNKRIYWMDTLLFAKRLLLNQEYFTQITLCRRFKIDVDVSHRALADVESLGKLYDVLLRLYPFDPHPASLEDYINLID